MTTPLQQAAQAMIDRWESLQYASTLTPQVFEPKILKLRKALDAELAQSVEPEVLMVDAAMVEMKNIVPPLRRSECLRLIRAAINATAHPPQPQATTSAGEISESVIDEFLEDYEMIGESEDGLEGCYVPDENDKALIKDAVFGLLEHVSTLAIEGEKP